MDASQELLARFIGLMSDPADPAEWRLKDWALITRALMRAETRIQVARLTTVQPEDPRGPLIAAYVEAVARAASYAWLLFADPEEAARTIDAGRATFDLLERYTGQLNAAAPSAPSRPSVN